MNTLAVFSAKYLIYFVAALTGYLLLQAWSETKSRDKKKFVVDLSILVISMVVAIFVAKAIEYFVPTQRPFVVGNFIPLIPHLPDASFPSDHAVLAGVFSGFNFFQEKRIGLISFILLAVMAWARVFAGLHYAIDVVGGLVVGVLVVILVRYLVNKKFKLYP